MRWIRAESGSRTGRVLLGAVAATWLGIGACDDGIAPTPPKHGNLSPETFLMVNGDSLRLHLYKVFLRWYGTDADGSVAGYRYRWTCVSETEPCAIDSTWTSWHTIHTLADTFAVPVPDSAARYSFAIAAVDDQGAADPTPASQTFALYNGHPVASFKVGLQPQRTLPAATFYVDAVDPDSTADATDRDSRASISRFEAWLDGQEGEIRTAPASQGAVTFFPDDFHGNYGPRTVFVRAVDDGESRSVPVHYTWQVDTPPLDGVLLVDDCRMAYSELSDSSFVRALRATVPGRFVVLRIAGIPRLSRPDLEATLSLFRKVVWYTDADTTSSGALELSKQALLDLLQVQAGRLFLSSGLVFGTRSAFGELELQFRDLFGIAEVFRAPNGSTNFTLSQEDTVRAAVTPQLGELRFLTLGLRAIMECFGSVQGDASTQALYFYPVGTFRRPIGESNVFTNPVQFDIGVRHELANGGQTAYFSFPIGVPINTNSGENEAEIEAILRRMGLGG